MAARGGESKDDAGAELYPLYLSISLLEVQDSETWLHWLPKPHQNLPRKAWSYLLEFRGQFDFL